VLIPSGQSQSHFLAEEGLLQLNAGRTPLLTLRAAGLVRVWDDVGGMAS
jgi:hypothetical protein